MLIAGDVRSEDKPAQKEDAKQQGNENQIDTQLLLQIRRSLTIDNKIGNPVAALAEEAQKDYDVVASQIEVVAQIVISEAEKVDLESKDAASIDWGKFEGTDKMFVDTDGNFKSLPTEEIYVLAATNAKFFYRLKNVRRVLRTGDRQYPLEATALIGMMTKTRTAEQLSAVPLPVRAGYREATKEELTERDDIWSLDITTTIVEEEEESLDSRRVILRRTIAYDRDTKDLPESVLKIAKELRKKCLAAKPVEAVTDYEVTFRYSVEKKKWRWWRTEKAAGARGLRDYGQEKYF